MLQVLSTLEPTTKQRTAAAAIAALSLVVFLIAAPFAKRPLTPIVGFVAAYQSAFVLIDLITAVLLFAQFRMLRSTALLWLAGAYVFSALMSTAHAISFPGLFAPAGLFGGAQTTAWIYFLWHAAFPVFVVAYTSTRHRGPSLHGPRARDRIILTIVAACSASAAFVMLASADVLPPIMVGHQDSQVKVVVAMVTWLSPLSALAHLWRARPHTVLDLWIMVALCVWSADIALAALLNGARFDVGWYAGRVFGLLTSAFVLGVLLLENFVLYARLSEKHALLEEASREKSEYAAALRDALVDLETANRDLRAFVGSLAHDLQQPITTIASFAQVLQRQPHAHPTSERYLAKIVTAAEWAHRMIRALLEFARLGEAAVRTELVDLNSLVCEAKAHVCACGDVQKIDWKIGQLPTVQADRSLLMLALVNLLSNAVKYTRTTQQPVIAVERGPSERSIQIRDNGVGFDMQHAGRLFTPFERLHRGDEFEGTGMGLANVRRIVEKHGGTVSAHAQPGLGAVFTLALP